VPGEADGVERSFAAVAGMQLSNGLAMMATGLIVLVLFSEFECLVEVLGVVGLPGLGDVLLDSEVEDGDQKVKVGLVMAFPGVVIPEVLVFFVNTPDFGCIGEGVL
jgi:hypothetical protein